MLNTDKRIEKYIRNSADFAKPVLNHFRELVHEVCPEAEETIKWGFPHFDYRDQMMCSMASFKNHCAITFWKASMMKKSEKIFFKINNNAMGHLGQIKDLKDLPSDKLLKECIREAMKLNEDGIKVKRQNILPKQEKDTPEFLNKELKKNKTANEVYLKLSPSHKREYIEWLTEAKTDQTKLKRLTTTIEWLSEGKSRNWKYNSYKT